MLLEVENFESNLSHVNFSLPAAIIWNYQFAILQFSSTSLDPSPPSSNTSPMREADLIYDWNPLDGGFDYSTARVELNDETLRDGLQSPSVSDPSMPDKLRLLHLMADLGIASADIGLPGAGPRMVDQVRTLAWEIANSRLPLSANCAARTLVRDIEPIAQISQETGLAIEAATFIGSSPIRQYAEDWTLDRMLRVSEEAVTFAVRQGLPVMYVTEDTTRARPDTLKALYGNAIRWGARRLCLADTTGHATPSGVRNLVRFIRTEIISPSGEDVKLDWHGHRDRGLGIANCLAAIEAGVDRVHATALGVGERVGNTEMDLLIVNLRLLGLYTHDVSRLPEYCRIAAEATGVPIPVNYPVVGADAFRTGTGVHAAAIVKARKKGDAWLADRVYSSVPAGEFGLNQRIDISPQSGVSNVKCWLEEHGYDPEDSRTVDALFQAAKRSAHTLADEECHRLVEAARMGAVDVGN
jgi:2-isopropylmalate synthase